MNLIVLFEQDFVDAVPGRVRLEGRRARHVRKILRAAPGDSLAVGLVDGRVGTGLVRTIETRWVDLDVVLDAEPPLALDVVVVLAVPRPPVLRRSLAAIASLGVKEIELVDAERVEKSFWGSRSMRDEAIDEQLVLGLEQARDTIRPRVRKHPQLETFIEGPLPELLDRRSGVLADPRGEPTPASPWPTPGLVAIGPEGGWVAEELEALAGAGLRSVALGDRAVRVETAIPLILGRYL